MKVISFDCGVLNLAYVVADVQCTGVRVLGLYCERVCASRDSISVVVGSLKNVMDGIFARHTGVGCCIIEQQPPRNIKMKCLSHCLHMYCAQCGVADVRYVQPSWVHRVLLLPVSKNYKQKKRIAVSAASTHLAQHDELMHVHFLGLTKCDDVADALLQLLACAPQLTVSAPLICSSTPLAIAAKLALDGSSFSSSFSSSTLTVPLPTVSAVSVSEEESVG